jgi:hypothetical protein
MMRVMAQARRGVCNKRVTPQRWRATGESVGGLALVRAAMPPGRSLTTASNRTKRPSAARPRSSTRPSTGVSTLPPHSGTTTVFPSSSGSRPCSMAASPVAPPPSTTAFSISTRRSMASAMNFSFTSTVCQWGAGREDGG